MKKFCNSQDSVHVTAHYVATFSTGIVSFKAYFRARMWQRTAGYTVHENTERVVACRTDREDIGGSARQPPQHKLTQTKHA